MLEATTEEILTSAPRLSHTQLMECGKDGGPYDSTAIHSNLHGTGCTGMANRPLPEIWLRAPRTYPQSVTAAMPPYLSSMPLTAKIEASS